MNKRDATYILQLLVPWKLRSKSLTRKLYIQIFIVMFILAVVGLPAYAFLIFPLFPDFTPTLGYAVIFLIGCIYVSQQKKDLRTIKEVRTSLGEASKWVERDMGAGILWFVSLNLAFRAFLLLLDDNIFWLWKFPLLALCSYLNAVSFLALAQILLGMGFFRTRNSNEVIVHDTLSHYKSLPDDETP